MIEEFNDTGIIVNYYINRCKINQSAFK